MDIKEIKPSPTSIHIPYSSIFPKHLSLYVFYLSRIEAIYYL